MAKGEIGGVIAPGLEISPAFSRAAAAHRAGRAERVIARGPWTRCRRGGAGLRRLVEGQAAGARELGGADRYRRLGRHCPPHSDPVIDLTLGLRSYGSETGPASARRRADGLPYRRGRVRGPARYRLHFQTEGPARPGRRQVPLAAVTPGRRGVRPPASAAPTHHRHCLLSPRSTAMRSGYNGPCRRRCRGPGGGVALARLAQAVTLTADRQASWWQVCSSLARAIGHGLPGAAGTWRSLGSRSGRSRPCLPPPTVTARRCSPT